MRSIAALALVAFVSGCGVASAVVGRTPPPEVEIVQIELAYSNVFLMRTPRPILVDSGSPGDEAALRRALADRGLRLEDVALVVLTHGHADHSGGAAAIRSASGARIALGKGDVPMAAAGKNSPMVATGLMGRLLRPFVDFPYPPFAPDIVVETELDLAPFGVAGHAIAMPGHTPGSLVVVLDDRTAFVGDQILGGWFGGAVRAHSPGEHYYQEDLDQNHRNIRTLLERGIETFYLGHGGPVVAEDVKAEFGE